MSAKDYKKFIEEALKEAEKAASLDEVPIGAIIVDRTTQEIIGRGHNLTITNNDPSAHAEIMAIRAACAHHMSQRLPDCDLYVTLEPCAMCAAAISFARLHTIYFMAQDAKGGGVLHGGRFYEQTTCHHRPEIGVWPEGTERLSEAGQILKNFFSAKRRAAKSQ
jgi:tRNA(adenine34) deaminase